MKQKIAVLALLTAVALAAGCAKTEPEEKQHIAEGTDLCNATIREYLEAETEEEQAAILQQCSGINLMYQSLSFEWDGMGHKQFQVYFADNAEYRNARIYEVYVPTVTPDGVFLPGQTYFWKVENENGTVLHEDTFTVKDVPVRPITTSRIPNVRDIGGWKTQDGKTVKYEMIYRGGITNPDGENNFPEQDVTLFRDVLKIKSEIDLRITGVDDKNQTVSILGETAPYYQTPIHGYCYIIPGFHQRTPHTRTYDAKYTKSIREIFHVLADEANYPVYIHCNAGADRTGTVAYLINGVLGVSYEDLTRDFELTSFSQADRRWRSEIGEGGMFDDTGVMQDDDGNYVAWGKMHQMMMDNYGKESVKAAIENYLVNICGVPQEDIDSLRSIMLS